MRITSLKSDDMKIIEFDFDKPLEVLKASQSTKWRPLRDGLQTQSNVYPILKSSEVDSFRKEVRNQLIPLLLGLLPSLADTEKPQPPEDWSRE